MLCPVGFTFLFYHFNEYFRLLASRILLILHEHAKTKCYHIPVLIPQIYDNNIALPNTNVRFQAIFIRVLKIKHKFEGAL